MSERKDIKVKTADVGNVNSVLVSGSGHLA